MKSIESLFLIPVEVQDNFIYKKSPDWSIASNQEQTKAIFGDKWTEVDKLEDVEALFRVQKEWFLELFGFGTEENLKSFLSDKTTIIDTGCGLGYKAAWFAELAPHAMVIGIDISESARIASRRFASQSNLFFLQSDIASTDLKEGSIDFVVCDQVIMHTENPELTFKHLSELTSEIGEFACYVYRKKALPRELVDDYFRSFTHEIPNGQMWEFSRQLTELGKTLTDLNVKFICPDIPVLGIKGGEYDVQRFIYWNFLKCFWRGDWGYELNVSTNYDWYAPSNAQRFSKEEFLALGEQNRMITTSFHEEDACYSGRFKHA